MRMRVNGLGDIEELIEEIGRCEYVREWTMASRQSLPA